MHANYAEAVCHEANNNGKNQMNEEYLRAELIDGEPNHILSASQASRQICTVKWIEM